MCVSKRNVKYLLIITTASELLLPTFIVKIDVHTNSVS